MDAVEEASLMKNNQLHFFLVIVLIDGSDELKYQHVNGCLRAFFHRRLWKAVGVEMIHNHDCTSVDD